MGSIIVACSDSAANQNYLATNIPIEIKDNSSVLGLDYLEVSGGNQKLARILSKGEVEWLQNAKELYEQKVGEVWMEETIGVISKQGSFDVDPFLREDLKEYTPNMLLEFLNLDGSKYPTLLQMGLIHSVLQNSEQDCETPCQYVFSTSINIDYLRLSGGDKVMAQILSDGEHEFFDNALSQYGVSISKKWRSLLYSILLKRQKILRTIDKKELSKHANNMVIEFRNLPESDFPNLVAWGGVEESRRRLEESRRRTEEARKGTKIACMLAGQDESCWK